MNYRAIIREAWGLTQDNKNLIWWFAFAPALVTSLVSMGYLTYQALAFWNSPLIREGGNDHFLGDLVSMFFDFLKQSPSLGVLVVVIVAVIGLVYLFLPVFTQGALIQLVAKMRRGQNPSIAEGVSFGFNRFLQLFEYQLLIKTFSWISIFTEALFVLRNLGPESFKFFGWIFAFFLIIGFFLSILFTYSEYFIVLQRVPVFKSILKSSGLVVRQWHHTLFMLLLMVVISVRILFNILVALLVPALVIAPIMLFASFALTILGVIVGSIIGLVALYFASYFLGVFHVFSTAVWTFTFLELTHKEQQEEQVENGES